MVKYLVPLGIFGVIVAFLWVGLGRNPNEVPSPLIDKPAPAFQLPQLEDPEAVISPADMRGKVWLFNVWASWCTSCRIEHPLLVELARQQIVPVYGLNYKDERKAARQWLQRLGNPYVHSAFDKNGKVGIDYGVYGVPETYLIDKQGVIRYKHIGPLSAEVIENKIIPMVKELRG